jgi:ribosomal protein S18 acetylase RimI-like enzyme
VLLNLRPIGEEDLPFAMWLKEAAGWNQTEEDWRNFISFRPEGCFLAWDGDRRAGTVTTIVYQGTLGWVGMVLVAPELRGRGIGTALLGAALKTLEDVETVKLDATALGRRIYTPLGFLDERVLERRVRAPASPLAAPLPEESRVRPLVDGDLPAVLALDREAFGRSREQLLEAWRGKAPQYARAFEESGRVRGFCLGRPGSRREHLGPLIAEDFGIARALLLSALRALEGRAVLLDVPQGSSSWLGLLDDLGFRTERPFIRMARGRDRFPGRQTLEWAIAGPEVG